MITDIITCLKKMFNRAPITKKEYTKKKMNMNDVRNNFCRVNLAGSLRSRK